jgi:DNA primase catalytic subunit
LLGNQPYVKDVEIQFSGNVGFYVWGLLTAPQDVDQLREKLKSLLSAVKKVDGIKVTLRKVPGKRTVSLDLSPMKQLGSVRAEGSLDYRTGFISKKISPTQLETFDPLQDAILKIDRLKPAYSFREETLI